MVFTSIPLYLDPLNWQQQTNHHHQVQGSITTVGNSHELLQPPPLPPTGGGGGGAGSAIRACNSMVDRARMAKLPLPETALKCPRCESTNTKFCYFNNYSLAQPRHFCKTCRRYWTRGGALRSVPVGGGCRRNKKSKSSNSKSTAILTSACSTNSSIPSNSCTSSDMIGHISTSQLPNFMASLHHLSDYGSSAADIGLGYGTSLIQQPSSCSSGMVDFQMGSNCGGSTSLSSRLAEQWRMQQLQHFPFLAASLESTQGIYPYEGEGVDEAGYSSKSVGQIRAKPSTNSLSIHGQIPPVKMEENHHQGLMRTLSARQFLGIPGNDHHQYLGGGNNAWTDLSNFTSSTTINRLT